MARELQPGEGDGYKWIAFLALVTYVPAWHSIIEHPSEWFFGTLFLAAPICQGIMWFNKLSARMSAEQKQKDDIAMKAMGDWVKSNGPAHNLVHGDPELTRIYAKWQLSERMKKEIEWQQSRRVRKE